MFILSSDVMLLLVSVTFYRCIEKRHSKSFLPHFSTSVEIPLKSKCVWKVLFFEHKCFVQVLNDTLSAAFVLFFVVN